MDIYYFLTERLGIIRFLYETAAEALREDLRKIEAGEEPYDGAHEGYDVESGEPPFLNEFLRTSSALMFLGHAGIAMLQVALKLYLDAYKTEVDSLYGKQKWVPAKRTKIRSENWFAKYREVFLNVLGIDWNEFGDQHIGILEQITLARDDIFHKPEIWTLHTYQSGQHFAKYTEPFFVDDLYLEHARKTGKPPIGKTWALDVPPEKMREAIDLVDGFGKFMEDKWLTWTK